jgi:hypothetical protein
MCDGVQTYVILILSRCVKLFLKSHISFTIHKRWFRDSSIGISIGYRLEGRGLISARFKRFFNILHNIQTGSGTRPVSYLTSTGGSFMQYKAPEAWS